MTSQTNAKYLNKRTRDINKQRFNKLSKVTDTTCHAQDTSVCGDVICGDAASGDAIYLCRSNLSVAINLSQFGFPESSLNRWRGKLNPVTDVGDSASDTHNTGSVILLIHVCHPPALTTVIPRWRDRSNPPKQPPLTDCERQCVISRQQGVITVTYVCVRHIVAASGNPTSTETIPQTLKQFDKH